MAETVTLEVFRYRPEGSDEPWFDAYEVPVQKEWTILDGLNYVKNHLDGTLAYRWSCRMGICGSCGLLVNGNSVLTCATHLEDHLPGPIRIEPLRGFPVVRDVVSDLTDFIQKLQRVKPWVIRDEERPPSEGAYTQTPEDLAEFRQYSMCINCMLCYSACPIYELEPDFIGPAALALAQRYNLDSRDQGADIRAMAAGGEDGIWACTFIGECSTVCPKNVDPAGAIQRYKVETTSEAMRSLLTPWGNR